MGKASKPVSTWAGESGNNTKTLKADIEIFERPDDETGETEPKRTYLREERYDWDGKKLTETFSEKIFSTFSSSEKKGFDTGQQNP